jgi:hypothetical protein
MPDAVSLIQATAVAAITVAAVALFARWLLSSRPMWSSADCIIGVGLGCFIGCWRLGIQAKWPPEQDQDRLLLFLLPLAVVVEAAAVYLKRQPYLKWVLRAAVALAAARILLHGSVYVANVGGPSSRQWTEWQAWQVFTAMGGALLLVWFLTTQLNKRASGWPGLAGLALACAGAGITVMLSGYATGGQIGFAALGALSAAALVSSVLRPREGIEGTAGVGLIVLYAVLVVGRFFGELPTWYAVVLLASPLVGWLPELPYVRRLTRWLREPLRIGVVLVPIALVVILAQRKFVEDSARSSPSSTEPSIQDYIDFGK